MNKNKDLSKMTKAQLIEYIENFQDEIDNEKSLKDQETPIDEALSGYINVLFSKSEDLYLKYQSKNILPQDILNFLSNMQDVDYDNSESLEHAELKLKNEASII